MNVLLWAIPGFVLAMTTEWALLRRHEGAQTAKGLKRALEAAPPS